MSRSILALSAVAAVLAAGGAAVAHQSGAAGAHQSGAIPAITQPDAFKWAPAPGLPEGAEITVLYGDPYRAGPFGIRLKFPAGYEVPTHSHPTTEFITVLSGTGFMSFGESPVVKKVEALPTGAFMSLPGGAWHHLWAETDMVVDLISTGPFDVHVLTN